MCAFVRVPVDHTYERCIGPYVNVTDPVCTTS